MSKPTRSWPIFAFAWGVLVTYGITAVLAQVMAPKTMEVYHEEHICSAKDIIMGCQQSMMSDYTTVEPATPGYVAYQTACAVGVFWMLLLLVVVLYLTRQRSVAYATDQNET